MSVFLSGLVGFCGGTCSAHIRIQEMGQTDDAVSDRTLILLMPLLVVRMVPLRLLC